MQDQASAGHCGREPAAGIAQTGGKVGSSVRHLISIAAVAVALTSVLPSGRALPRTMRNGGRARRTRAALPVPRFVSLKSDKVNVRKGPSTDQAIVWVFSRAGLPVEVIAESDNWRRVRDSEGADGWVFHSLLSARRTALITPWSKGDERVPLYSSQFRPARAPSPSLQSGVLGNVLSCDGEWCNVSVDDYSGYVQQDKLWGVYRTRDQ